MLDLVRLRSRRDVARPSDEERDAEPPSQRVRLPPRNGALLSWKTLAPWLPVSNVAPWSLVKTTSVSSASVRAVQHSRTRPTFRSSRVTIAA